MKHLFFTVLTLILLCNFAGCGDINGSDSSNDNTIIFNENYISSLEKVSFDVYSAPQNDENFNNFVKDFNRFAIEQYLFAAHNYGKDRDLSWLDLNVGISNYTFYQLLGMTASGTSSNTATQFSEGFPFLNSPEFFISLRESVLSDNNLQQGLTAGNFFIGQQNYTFLKNYFTELIQYFNPQFYCHDFVTLGSALNQSINDLTYGSTHKLLSHSLDYDGNDEKVRFVRGSSLSISNDWKFPFNNMSTFEGIFETSFGFQFYVPMIRWQGNFNSYEDDRVSAFELPIGTGALAMTVFMPKEGEFYTFENTLLLNLPEIIEMLSPADRDVTLPLFSINYTYSNYDFSLHQNRLNEFLESRGITHAFDEKNADYSGVNGLGYNYLAGIGESLNINMEESSINVFGATLSTNIATENEPDDMWSIGHTSSSDPIFIKENISDVFPFIVAIRDTQRGTLLFLGRVVDIGGTLAGTLI